MSGVDAARGVAAWCVVALNFLGSPVAALPVAGPDIAQVMVETMPEPAHMRFAAIDPAAARWDLPSRVIEPFGLRTRRVLAGGLWNKWSAVEAAVSAERDILARCRSSTAVCPPAAARFLAIVAAGRAHSGRARLGQINRAVNMAIRPMSDIEQHGVDDRWSSPLATLAAGRGDCEDYAIVKYVALQEAGIAASDLRLVIVREQAVNVEHAVVAVQLDGRWIVLDNRHLVLVADTDLGRVDPLFVLDGAGVKQFSPGAISVAGDSQPADGAGATPAGL